MFRIRELLNPKHTALSVAQTLVQGLEDGSIVLSNESEAEAIERELEPDTELDASLPAIEIPSESVSMPIDQHLALLRQVTEQWNEWRRQNPDIRPNLRNATLIYADLSGADLRNADLLFATLISADLSDASLSGADLLSANLSGADLSGADLSGADLHSADLWDVNLSGANLSGANLSGANLSGADLRGVKVQDARFGEGLGLSDEEKQSLVERGAIFDDASGDREAAYSPSRP